MKKFKNEISRKLKGNIYHIVLKDENGYHLLLTDNPQDENRGFSISGDSIEEIYKELNA